MEELKARVTELEKTVADLLNRLQLLEGENFGNRRLGPVRPPPLVSVAKEIFAAMAVALPTSAKYLGRIQNPVRPIVLEEED